MDAEMVVVLGTIFCVLPAIAIYVLAYVLNGLTNGFPAQGSPDLDASDDYVDGVPKDLLV